MLSRFMFGFSCLLFSVMSGLACLVVLAALLLPVQSEAHRLDRQPAE